MFRSLQTSFVTDQLPYCCWSSLPKCAVTSGLFQIMACMGEWMAGKKKVIIKKQVETPLYCLKLCRKRGWSQSRQNGIRIPQCSVVAGSPLHTQVCHRQVANYSRKSIGGGPHTVSNMLTCLGWSTVPWIGFISHHYRWCMAPCHSMKLQTATMGHIITSHHVNGQHGCVEFAIFLCLWWQYSQYKATWRARLWNQQIPEAAELSSVVPILLTETFALHHARPACSVIGCLTAGILVSMFPKPQLCLGIGWLKRIPKEDPAWASRWDACRGGGGGAE